MIPVIVVIAALSGLVALNRSGRIGNEFFAAAVALILLVWLVISVYRNIDVTCHKGRLSGL